MGKSLGLIFFSLDDFGTGDFLDLPDPKNSLV